MAAGLQMVAARPYISSSRMVLASGMAVSGFNKRVSTCANKFKSSLHISSAQPLALSRTSVSLKFNSLVTRAMSTENEKSGAPGLPIDLRGNHLIDILLLSLFFHSHDCLLILVYLLFYKMLWSTSSPAYLICQHIFIYI